MTQKVYLQVSGATSPLRVLLGIFVPNEVFEKIPAYFRKWLFNVFVKLVSPEEEKKFLEELSEEEKQDKLITELFEEITKIRKQKVSPAKSDFWQQGNAIQLQLDISDEDLEKRQMIENAINSCQAEISELTGLYWLALRKEPWTKREIDGNWVFIKAKKDHEAEKKMTALSPSQRGNLHSELRWMLIQGFGLFEKDFSIKVRKKRGKDVPCYHLWIDPRIVTQKNLKQVGLKSQSDYRPIEEIFETVKNALQQYKTDN